MFPRCPGTRVTFDNKYGNQCSKDNFENFYFNICKNSLPFINTYYQTSSTITILLRMPEIPQKKTVISKRKELTDYRAQKVV